MRATSMILVLAAMTAAGACHKAVPKPAATAALPPAEAGQAPGLWVERVSDSRGVRVTRYCLDATASAGLAALNRQLNGKCERHDMATDSAGAWHFVTRCNLGAAGVVETKGDMRGDFSSHYVVEATTQTMGAKVAAANGPGRVLADVKRLGDCPKDMKPGDISTPGQGPGRLSDLPGQT